MDAAAFVDRAMALPGIPWVRWASTWRECDCYGLIVLWFREVRGVDLGDVPQTDLASGFSRATGWAECEPEPGATAWMAYADGSPTHCGILLPAPHDGMVLHSLGGDDHAGGVRITRLPLMRRLYSDLRFYRYAGAPAC
jgi:cell wall-associated NlpC family hydrolase